MNNNPPEPNQNQPNPIPPPPPDPIPPQPQPYQPTPPQPQPAPQPQPIQPFPTAPQQPQPIPQPQPTPQTSPIPPAQPQPIPQYPPTTPAQPQSYQYQPIPPQTPPPMQPIQPISSFPAAEPPKKSKKIPLIIGISLGAIILITAIILLVTLLPKQLSNEDPSKRPNRTGTRTLMIYMVGSNLESDPVQGGAATLDIQEIIDANVSQDVEVVIYAGGAKRWKNGWQNGNIYELNGSGFEQVKSLGAGNTGDPKTLQTFIDYAYENYQTDLYNLVFWDHGAGPVIGFGSDELYQDDIFQGGALLSINEISDTIANSELITTGKKFEMIGFDACLMATAEIAASLESYADWLVASQESEPGYGWNYDFLSGVDKTTNSEQLGTKIIDTYKDFYAELSSTYSNAYFDLTLSLVDLTKIKTLISKMDSLFTDVRNTLDDGSYSQIVSQITRAQFFGDTSFDLVDLYGVADYLNTDFATGAPALSTAVKNAVAYQYSNITGANGLSIYYPYYTKSVLSQLLPLYEKLEFSGEYTKFLSSYSKILTGQRLTNWQLKSTTPTIQDGTISVKLNQEIVKDYNKANYLIFAEVEDNRWTPVYRSSDVSLSDDGTLTANFNKKQFTVISDETDGKYEWATMYEHRREADHTIYHAPGMLFNSEEFKFKSIYTQYKVDNKTQKGEIIGYIPMATSNTPESSKEIIDLSKWDTISLLNFSYKIFDTAGNYTDDWEGGGEIFGNEFHIGEDIKIELKDLDKTRTYYCLFQIYDTQGNPYATNIVKIAN